MVSMNEDFEIIEIVAEDQLSDVKVKGKVKEGTFTKGPYKMVEMLLDETNGNIGKAIKKLVFYKNRAGKDMPNKKAVDRALKILQNKKDME